MIGKLSELITGESVATWLLIAILVGYFIYKEWPDFKRRVTSGALKDQKDEMTDHTMGERLTAIEDEIKKVNGKLDRDYQRINKAELDLENYKFQQSSTAEELGIIMEALMGALGGLQELGANGPTKEAKGKIQDYLNKKAHMNAKTS